MVRSNVHQFISIGAIDQSYSLGEWMKILMTFGNQ